jgi:hypothetical protein
MTNKMFERTTADGQVFKIVEAQGQRGYAFYVDDELEACDYDKGLMFDRVADYNYDFASEWRDWVSKNNMSI